MAFVDPGTKVIVPGFPNSDFIYNVTMAVGPNQPNNPDDVMLVQYFLNRIWARPNNFSPPLEATPPGTMNPDGIFGPITATWITAFQQQSKDRGHPSAIDGRVDKSPAGGTNGVVFFAIAEMNTAFLIAYPDIPFNDIASNDPNCPAGLQTLFNSANTSATTSSSTSTSTS